MKPEDIRVASVYSSNGPGYAVLSIMGTVATFHGPDAQQYAEEHAQKLRDKLPKPRWTTEDDCLKDGSVHICLPSPLHYHTQRIADLLNELEP